MKQRKKKEKKRMRYFILFSYLAFKLKKIPGPYGNYFYGFNFHVHVRTHTQPVHQLFNFAFSWVMTKKCTWSYETNVSTCGSMRYRSRTYDAWDIFFCYTIFFKKYKNFNTIVFIIIISSKLTMVKKMINLCENKN